MKHTEFSEKIILIKAKRGDKDAFAQIYDWYVKKIYRFVFFKVNTHESAEDITQDVFLKIIDYLDQTKTVKSLQALLYQIARNLVNDYYRSQQVKPTTGLESIENNSVFTEDYQGELDNLIEVKHSIEVVKKSLNDLKDEHKEIIILRFIEELTHREIARVLDKNENHVRVILHRAINELRKILKDSHL